MRSVPALVLGVLLVGCNDSTAPQFIDVTGTWTYAASNMVGTDSTGGAVTCTASGTMTLKGTGKETVPNSFFGGTITVSGFTGTYSNLTLNCTVNGVQQTRGPLAGTVSNGEVFPYSPTTADFDFDSGPDSVATPWSNLDAPTTANNMTGGSVTTVVNFGPPIGHVTVAGSFSATNQH